MNAAIGSARGFTLVEVLVGSTLSLAVIALACHLAADVQVAWRSAAARVDVQQRARVTADLVSRLLREAGAGPMSGPARASLIRGSLPSCRGESADVARTPSTSSGPTPSR